MTLFIAAANSHNERTSAALRWRSFVRPLLLIHLLQVALLMFVAFYLKPPPVEVPGQWFNLGVLVVLTLVAAYEFLLRPRNARS